MATAWVTTSSNRLPHEGEPVEFVVDDRRIALGGTYAGRLFQSRWSPYDVARVSSWRAVAGELDAVAASLPAAAACA